ncbi:hypothetical protein ABZX85_11070 [Streptomyces sp. NPDC004539]|uniref:hypothetical protein n=1 Tax=Streptomyces sp. NPDC004539 TaxID=3154280 RepID=UPI0033BD2E4E
MRRFVPALLAASFVATALTVAIAPLASASAAAGCRYYYTSYYRGPNGETKGSGEYREGDHDPEGRICRNGWWVSPYELDGGI